MRHDICPVCKAEAEVGRPGGRDALQVRCPRCGPFVLTGTAVAMFTNRLAADSRAVARASHAIRTRTTEANWLEIDSTFVDGLIAQALPAPGRQLSNLLSWLKLQAGDAPFGAIDITNHDALAAIVGAVDLDGLDRLLDWGGKEGFLELMDSGRAVSLKPKAWEEREAANVKGIEMPKSASIAVVVKGHCPKCGPDISADVVASHKERWDHEEAALWSVDTYSILKCRGCDAIYVQHKHVFSEDEDYERDPHTGGYRPVYYPKFTYWPAPARRVRPEWTDRLGDDVLRDLLDEVYAALDADQRVLAAIGIRTVLDRAMVLTGATEAFGFGEKLDEIKESGLIGQREKEILIVLTDAGGAAAHRGWRPEPPALATIIDGAEAFLYRALVLGDAVKAIQEEVPGRPRRPKKGSSEPGRGDAE